MSFVENPHETTAKNNLVVTSYIDENPQKYTITVHHMFPFADYSNFIDLNKITLPEDIVVEIPINNMSDLKYTVSGSFFKEYQILTLENFDCWVTDIKDVNIEDFENMLISNPFF